MYSQCIQFFVTATWTVTETQTNRRWIFLFTFSYLSVVLYTKITKYMNLRNILINMTKIRSIGTFVGDKQEQNTHVFDTTARLVKWRPPRRDEDGRAHSRPQSLRSFWPAFSTPEPTILLARGRNRELWEQPFQACAIDADAQWAG